MLYNKIRLEDLLKSTNIQMNAKKTADFSYMDGQTT